MLIGDRALVNPSVREVLAAVRAEYPDDADRLLGSADAPSPLPSGWGTAGG